jgi:hypothetical protein
LKTSMAEQLSLDENTQMKYFSVTATRNDRRRRGLLGTSYTWDVSFEAMMSLEASGHKDTDAWSAAMADTITSPSFSGMLSGALGIELEVDADSLTMSRVTRNPTPAPSEVYVVRTETSAASVAIWFIASGGVCSLAFGVCLLIWRRRKGQLKLPAPLEEKSLETSHMKHIFIDELLGNENGREQQQHPEAKVEKSQDDSNSEEDSDGDSFYGAAHHMSSMTDLADGRHLSKKTIKLPLQLRVGDPVKLRPIDQCMTIAHADTKLAEVNASLRRTEAKLEISEAEEERLRQARSEHRIKTSRDLRVNSDITVHKRRLSMLQDPRLHLFDSTSRFYPSYAFLRVAQTTPNNYLPLCILPSPFPQINF